MNNSKLTLAIVCAVGILVGYFLNALTAERPPTANSSRDLEITATMSHTEVETLRESRFEELESIEEILRLPSMFARSEATYALAGRSSGSGVQQLIFEAHEIADPVERDVLLNILFARLTEIDANAALATARIEPFSVNLSAENSVWRTWARSDLESAVDAVLSESQPGTRNRIAQILFRSLGYTGTAETDLVEAWLGIEPDGNTISQYILYLADQSPTLAIDYINQQAPPNWQPQHASKLGTHLALSGVDEARRYKDNILNPRARGMYEGSLMTAEANADPVAAMENWLAGSFTMQNQRLAYGAISRIVESDLDLALSYYDRIEAVQIRRWLGQKIAQQYAADDIDAALQWARENEIRGREELQSLVLQVMAQSDPDRAFEEVREQLQSETGLDARKGSASAVLMAIAQTDPHRAFGYLSEIESHLGQNQLKSVIFNQWMTSEPDAAIDWALGQQDADEMLYLSGAGMLIQQDINRAIELLPRLPDSVSANWRMQIAATLVEARSLDEAMAFARTHSAKPGYESMLATIAQSAVRSGPEVAMAVASEIGDSRLRDQTYATIVQRMAQRDPQQAINYLERVSDNDLRIQVTAGAVRSWYRSSPASAVSWIAAKPPGQERDRIVAMVSSYWVETTAQEQQLIDAIADPQTRSQIEMHRIVTVSRTDPAKARQMLNSGSFSEEERRSVEHMIEQTQSRTSRIYN